jgi:uncharacterized secreted protein with C-terminal beta-propeller domain
VRPAIPALPPPPTITAAMPGDPSGKALADARLVSASCEKVSTEQIEAKVREMRAAVDAMYREWHATQPQCWEDDREQYRMRKEIESGGGRAYAPRPSMQSGDTFSLSDAMASSAARAPSAAPAPSATATASPAGPPAKNAAAKKPGEPAAARSASGTNNQVVGVDEADIVKTDGRYVYLAANGALRIVEALDPRVVSVTRIGGVTRELFVEGDRAVVYTSSGGSGARCTYGYDCAFGGDGTSTKITVLDISDRKAPKTVREMDLSGSLLTARRIGNAIHTVVADPDRSGPGYATWPDDIGMCGVMENVVRAKLAKLKADNERAIRAQTTVTAFPTVRENGAERAMCTGGGLLRTAMRDGQAFTSVVSFDLADAKAPPATATIQSRPGAVFASGGALYLSVTHQRPEGGRWYSSYAATPEASEIHKFRIGASPRETRYVGSGLVPGHVLSQFAMDEWFGYLRVATTKGRVPDPGVSSVVSILAEGEEGNLVRVGAIDKIAPGEDIRAVRFDDDRGYVVTFKKTDPLFVMDLYQPAHPKILGELKIPGFSTYMHRIDRDHLLSIGFDANDHGDFAYFDGVILQLFDVKSPTDPRLVHKEKIGTRGSSSQAAADHLAFNYFADRGLLAVPMTVCDGGSDGVNGSLVSFSGLYVYDVSPETGFKRLGGVSHGSEGVSCGTWWSSATSAVKRSVFLDDLVYSIASDRVKVQNMSHFGKDVADIALTP